MEYEKSQGESTTSQRNEKLLGPYSIAQQYHNKEVHSSSCTLVVECILGMMQALVSIPNVQNYSPVCFPKHICEMTKMFYSPLGNDFQLVKLFTIQMGPQLPKAYFLTEKVCSKLNSPTHKFLGM